jgi:hypothetical protein
MSTIQKILNLKQGSSKKKSHWTYTAAQKCYLDSDFTFFYHDPGGYEK